MHRRLVEGPLARAVMFAVLIATGMAGCGETAPQTAAPTPPASSPQTTAPAAPAAPQPAPAAPGTMVVSTNAVAGEPGASAPAPGPAASAPAVASPVSWPAIAAKQLYATTDLRGKPAPEFSVEEWIGTPPETKGKVLLIDFWATWCGPCRALIPELEEWQKQFKDDLVVVGVSDEPMNKVLSFITQRKVAYPMAIDTRGSTLKKTLGVQGIPHVLIVDSKGIVRWQGFPQLPQDRLTADVIAQIIKADKQQRGQ
jgi:cytochrome c biogenesis protein CcmG, thiol:disulfide interchange protein DsbE